MSSFEDDDVLVGAWGLAGVQACSLLCHALARPYPTSVYVPPRFHPASPANPLPRRWAASVARACLALCALHAIPLLWHGDDAASPDRGYDFR